MKKKRRLKKKIKIILLSIFIILLLGGIILFIKKNNNLDKKEININDNTNENLSKEEVVNNEIKKAPSNNNEFASLSDGEYTTDKGFKLIIKDGLAYIDNNLIVNKTYSLPSDYKPTNTYSEVTSLRCNDCLDKEVMNAYNLMKADASSIGLNIYIASGYRSYEYQNTLYNNYSAVSGKEGADTYSARPGHSEHQSGLCFDLNTVDETFANTAEGKWINNNAHLYGFVIRYPKGKDNVTGYIYESWHLRYVGRDLAKKLYNDGDWITLEEYYGISSSY